MHGHRCLFNTKGSSMVKKLLILGVIVLAGLFLLKKTNLCSYAGTVWSQVRQEAKAQVPTKFELDRIRHEIGQMDGDIQGMVGPIAEHMTAISWLKKDMDKTRTRLAEHKADIQTMVADLDKGGEIKYDRTYSPERIKAKVLADTAACKRLESHLAKQEQLVAAKEKALDATRAQLSKLISRKREFEVRLAELETNEEVLAVARLTTNVPVDNSRTAELNKAIDEIAKRQDREQKEIELRNNGELVTDSIDVRVRDNGNSLEDVRNWLQGTRPQAATRTASNK
jgi:hypothetical protein